MSRIHDALKKAQEERAGIHTSDVDIQTAVGPLREPAPRLEDAIPMPALDTNRAVSLRAVVEKLPMAAWKPQKDTVLFAEGGARPVGTEEFRTLRSHLSQMREKQPLQTILITSSMPSEGKTFVAVNLAQAIVQQRGQRALLIDADLRLPKLHEVLGALQSPGLTEYLRGEADEAAILQRGLNENLFLIAAGRVSSNPVELISNGRIKSLLQKLSPVFDWIILDSPPCVPLSDSTLLADFSDGVLMVVRAESTPFDVAQKGCHLFKEKHLLGVVLNSVAPQAAYSTYYYSAYAQQAAKSEEAKPEAVTQ
jgi:capsular exopolysaccharide synthesis family protein